VKCGPAWLPGVTIPDTPESRHAGTTAAGATFIVPELSADQAAGVATHVRNAALASRRSHTMPEVIAAISRAALRLADSSDPIGARAVAALQSSGGWPRQAAQELLTSNAVGWTDECLTSLVCSELGDMTLLETPQTDPGRAGRRRQAAGPPVLFLMLAGNVPGVAVTAVIRGMLVRSAVLCKLPRDEPDLVGLFARALAEEDPALAETVAATWWPADEPGQAAVEWTKCAGKAVVYGGAEAVAHLRTRIPVETPLVEYGPKLGVVCIGAAVTDEELSGLARDVCAYDQAGCVSPRLVYLLGDFPEPEGADVLVGRLAEALGAETARSPGTSMRDEEAVAVRAARATIQFGSDDGAQALGAEDLTWTVLYQDSPGTYSESLPRTVWAYRAASENDLLALGAVLEGRVQAMGVAGLERSQRETIERIAVEWGVSRVVTPGEMAWPPADWRHDGRFQLLPLLRLTEFE